MGACREHFFQKGDCQYLLPLFKWDAKLNRECSAAQRQVSLINGEPLQIVWLMPVEACEGCQHIASRPSQEAVLCET